MLYFEDFHEGQTFSCGSKTVDKDEVIAFATAYDPQPFHIDEEAAKASPYGGLIASGWHTAAMVMRMLVDDVFADSASMGSPGLDEIRWVRPVRPGDTLRVEMKVLGVKASQSKPDRGFVDVAYKVFNQEDTVVMTFRGTGMYGRRPIGEEAGDA